MQPGALVDRITSAPWYYYYCVFWLSSDGHSQATSHRVYCHYSRVVLGDVDYVSSKSCQFKHLLCKPLLLWPQFNYYQPNDHCFCFIFLSTSSAVWLIVQWYCCTILGW